MHRQSLHITSLDKIDMPSGTSSFYTAIRRGSRHPPPPPLQDSMICPLPTPLIPFLRLSPLLARDDAGDTDTDAGGHTDGSDWKVSC